MNSFLVALTLVPSNAVLPTAPKKPNIILIVSDDQGYADAGFQGIHSQAQTPNLDAMAKDGVRCTRGYVTAPVCSPSRAALMTGRYQQRFGHHNNLVAEAGRPDAHLPFSERTLAEILKEAGYATALVGKWHLGLQEKARPYERGFTDFFGIITGGHDFYQNDPLQKPKGDNDYRARIERNGKGEKVEKYLTDAFADEAVNVIKSHRDKPFFIYLAFNAPHTPNQAPEELINAVPKSVTRPARRRMLAQITSMDTAIGRVRATVRELGLEKDTLIVFFSDNGGAKVPANNSAYDNTPLRNHKGSLYEGGIRVPFLACFPGIIPAGSVCDLPVTSLDVFATACKLAGANPDSTKLDSKDMMPVLTGKSKRATHDSLFWEFPSFGAAISQGNLKLVMPNGGKPELYDLSKDGSEKADLSSVQPENVLRLQELFGKWKANNTLPKWGPGSNPSGRMTKEN